MSTFQIKISKDVDYCLARKPEMYVLQKIGEDDEFNYFEGKKPTESKWLEILILVNTYKVYNTLERTIAIVDDADVDKDGNKTVVFMLNADPEFVGAMIILGEEFDNTIIFMEDLETAKSEQREKIESLGFDKSLKNYYRAIRIPANLLTKANLSDEIEIVLYQNSAIQTLDFEELEKSDKK